MILEIRKVKRKYNEVLKQVIMHIKTVTEKQSVSYLISEDVSVSI